MDVECYVRVRRSLHLEVWYVHQDIWSHILLTWWGKPGILLSTFSRGLNTAWSLPSRLWDCILVKQLRIAVSAQVWRDGRHWLAELALNIVRIAFFRVLYLGLPTLGRIYGLILSEKLIDERVLLKLGIAVTSILRSLIYFYFGPCFAVAAVRTRKSNVIFIFIELLSVILCNKVLVTI